MNAIEFLVKEHEQVRQLLNDISQESQDEEARKKLFASLCQDLLRHESMEHTVWYPHFKNDRRLTDKVKHLLKEEKGAERAIKHFEQVTDEDAWFFIFSKFKMDVEMHALEEEELLFPQLKKLMSEEDLIKIGQDMSDFKRNYSS